MVDALMSFLQERRYRITRSITVQTPPAFDPTYGPGEPGQCDIEVVDFDALMAAIDDFGRQLREKNDA